jgi:MFS superfamily sulfate permease-like transporter
VSAARALAQKHGSEIDPRQELLALAAANCAVAFAHGYPVAGGLSQSTVNDKAGARTPLALVFASITIAVCLLFLTGLLRNLPEVVLAAIVLVAVRGLINVPELRRVWTLSRMEFSIALAAFAGVLLLGILRGCSWPPSSPCCCSSTARPIRTWRGSAGPGHPPLLRLRAPPDNEAVPGVLIVRVEASLLYFNVTHVRDRILRQVGVGGDGLRLVVWDLSAFAHRRHRRRPPAERDATDSGRPGGGHAHRGGACAGSRSAPQGGRDERGRDQPANFHR